MRLVGSDHQLLASNLDGLFRHDTQRVDVCNALNLREQPVEQPEISLCDADDRSSGLFFGCASGLKGKSPGGPLLAEEEAGLLGLEGPELMHKPHTGIELRLLNLTVR